MEIYLYAVRFSHTMKSLFVSSESNDYKKGDLVVCATSKGVEMGTITTACLENVNINVAALDKIERPATDFDKSTETKNIADAKAALPVFEKIVLEHSLNMQLVGAYYTLNRDKLVFTYIANERVDFRELLKSLAREFKTRIDLRQINPRDRAQFVGGIGICGLPLCCTTYLTDFEGITVQKAKNQMLVINSSKINGQCGKLICCLKHEDDTYTIERKEFPQLWETIKFQGVEYKVIGFNVIKRELRLESSNGIETKSLDEILGRPVKPKFKNTDDFKIIRSEETFDLPTQPANKEIETQPENEKTSHKEKRHHYRGKKRYYNGNKKQKFPKE